MSRRPRQPGTRITQFRIRGDRFAVVSVPLRPRLPASLTPAERAVILLVLGGASNAAIAKARRVSVRTVANQVATTLKKLGVASRAELIARSTK